MGVVPGFVFPVPSPALQRQDAMTAKRGRGQDVPAEQSTAKLRLVAQLLARQAARETFSTSHTLTPTQVQRLSSAMMPVVLGTATCP